jgi:nitrate/TMAO reductase-like tetraheme cytochrome c subunit
MTTNELREAIALVILKARVFEYAKNDRAQVEMIEARDALLALISPVMEENERFKSALEKIVNHESNVSDDHTECENCHDAFFDDYFEVRALARSALSTKSEKQDG